MPLDKKITELPVVTDAQTTDILTLVRPGDPAGTKNKQITEANLFKNVKEIKYYISVASDFPTLAQVEVGDVGFCTANVTDNDPTKTNTGKAFLAGQEIVWIHDTPNPPTWEIYGEDTLWLDDGTDYKTKNTPRNVNLQSGGLKDQNVTTDVKLGSPSDTSLNTTKKDLLGASNEILAKLLNLHVVMQQPNGFPNRTDSEILYNSTSRQITIQPKAPATQFDYYINGVKYTISTPQSLTHPDTTGLYYFYWDSTNTLQFGTGEWNFLKDVLISYVYYSTDYDGVGGNDGYSAEERHSSYRNPSAHLELHEQIGTYIIDGFAISGYTLQPGSPVDADNTFALALGNIADEDIRLSLPALPDNGPYTVYRRIGASGDWQWNKTLTLPFYVGATYIQYNQFTGATWQLTEGSNNSYYGYYVLKTTSLDGSFQTIIIPGQNEWSTLVGARSETLSSLQLGTLPFVEIAPLYQIIYRTSASYSGATGQCRIEEVNQLLGTKVSITQAAQPNHNALVGLQLAAAGVTWGHIDDQPQTIAGIKTFSSGTYHPDGSKITFGDTNDGEIEAISGDVFIKNTFPGGTIGNVYGYWKLNESAGTNASDSSINGRDGTTVSMEDGDWVAGKLNNCLSFDGINEYVDMNDIANFERTQAFSGEVWLKTSTTGAFQVIMGRQDQTAPARGWVFQIRSDNTVGLSLINTAGTNQLTTRSTNTVTDDAWHHVVFTYDGTSTPAGIKYYIDENLETSVTIANTLTATILQPAVDFQLAAKDGPNSEYTGLLDNVTLYDDVLTLPEVQARYNSGAGTESFSVPGAGKKLEIDAGASGEIPLKSVTKFDPTHGIQFGDSGQNVIEISTDKTAANPSDTKLITQAVAVALSEHWQTAVINFVDFTTAEPASPTVNDRYINTVTGTSSITTQSVTANYIYEWNGTTWTETIPTAGYSVWVENLVALYVYTGSAWVKGNITQQGITDSFTASAGQTVFSLSNTPSGKPNTAFYRNGNKQSQSDFSLSGNTLTWSGTTLIVGDAIQIFYDYSAPSRTDILGYKTITANYTITGTDTGLILLINATSDITITGPQTSTESIAAGFNTGLKNIGTTYDATIAKEGSDVLDGNTLLAPGASATIAKRIDGTPNTWDIYGGTTLEIRTMQAYLHGSLGNNTYRVIRPTFNGTITNIYAHMRAGTATITANSITISGTPMTHGALSLSAVESSTAVTANGAFTNSNYIEVPLTSTASSFDILIAFEYVIRV